MEITSGQPNVTVGGNGMDGFGSGFGMMFLAFLAIMGMGGGMFGGNRGVPNNVATTDTVNQAVQYSSLVDQNRDLANNINNSQAHQAECCCQIRQEIAAQTLRQQEQFGALQLQTEQKFAALSDRMYQNEIQGLRDQIQGLREQNFVQYPRGFTYNAGNNPFCACNGLMS